MNPVRVETEMLARELAPVLTREDIKNWQALNDECWDLCFWRRYVRSDSHFSIYERVSPGPDPKLLYDSYLWRLVIEQQFGGLPVVGRVLELLPGESRTIPIALESLQYAGKLDRLDLVAVPTEALGAPFPVRWIGADMLSSAARGVDYSLILGNHIVDDLLMFLHFPDGEQRQRMYSDQEHARRGWEAIAASERLGESQRALARAFVTWTTNLRPGAVLLLRHYPPTCAIRAANLLRINTELTTLHVVVEALRELECCCVAGAPLCDLPVPRGSKFPNSFVVVRRL